MIKPAERAWRAPGRSAMMSPCEPPQRITHDHRRLGPASGPLRPSEYGRPIPYLDQVAIDFPELVIVGGHIGYPWTEEMIAVVTKHPNVYVDTSAYTVRRYPPALVEFLRGHGRHKVLFGTNWPMIAPARALEGLAGLELGREVEQAFLAGNARRVFQLPDGNGA